MSRWASLIALAAIIAVFAFLFYQVMSVFLAPLFVALVLVVIFHPMHLWFVRRMGGREAVAAALSTLVILFLFLVPFTLVVVIAATEGLHLADLLSQPETLRDLEDRRNQLGLDLPPKNVERVRLRVRSKLDEVEDAVLAIQAGGDPSRPGEDLLRILESAWLQMGKLAEELEHARTESIGKNLWREDREWVQDRKQATRQLEQLRPRVRELEDKAQAALSAAKTLRAEALKAALEAAVPTAAPPEPKGEGFPKADEIPVPDVPADGSALSVTPAESKSADPAESPAAAPAGAPASPIAPAAGIQPIPALPPPFTPELVAELTALPREFADFETVLVGPRWLYGLKTLANPDEASVTQALSAVQTWIAPVAGSAAGFAGSLFLGFVVMIVALYYFFADGKWMIDSILTISPLDSRHERALLEQFESISRAVVVATVATAVVQGVLGAIGYWFVGLGNLFLLTLLTMISSMVPFVGASGVWIVCSLYLALIGKPVPATILAVYGITVISTIDNIIKPAILHGQSNLHPLPALLSVLGGVMALGPIGVFVGPMAVAFLQALLKIVQQEMAASNDAAAAEGPPLMLAGVADGNGAEPSGADEPQPPHFAAVSLPADSLHASKKQRRKGKR